MGDSCQSPICCVNCNLRINSMRRYAALQLDTRVTALFCNWVNPLIITEDDYICEVCKDLAILTLNQAFPYSDGLQDSTSPQGHTRVCLLCGCSILRKRSHPIFKTNPTPIEQYIIDITVRRVSPRQIAICDHICHPCWLRTQREAHRTPHPMNIDETRPHSGDTNTSQANQIQEDNQPDPIPEVDVQNIILPNYRRAANSNRHCIYTNCRNTTLHSISDHLRAIVLSNHKYYVPSSARIYSEHLMSNSWDLLFNSVNSINTFTAQHVQHIFSFINAYNVSLDFDKVHEIDDRIFEYWIGLSKEKFNILIQETPSLSQIKRASLGLAALLLKMRTGDSNERISSLVNVSRRTLELLMNQVRLALLQDFVSANLGINGMTRQDLLSHNLMIPSAIYGSNNSIVICDGTYIYINKSSNYRFQKESYSLHKYRNLLKPFMIVGCDGYIIDCFGPYKATTSDSEIMTSLFSSENNLRSYFREDDVFILDRGFRDSISLLEGCGYRAYMPESLLEGEHQLTTAQANRSRCVTICRWVVEAVNGHFKRNFKVFRQEFCHRSLPHMMQTFQIAAALLNRFGVRFQDNAYATEIIELINENMYVDNNLANMVDALNMNRRTSPFQSITADCNNVLYFPTLDSRDLILLSLGTYQIQQARSYYGEHVRLQGGYRIEVSSEHINFSEFNLRGQEIECTLIRGKIKSRHVSRRQYYVYICIQNDIPGRTGIAEYCCSCLVGRRTVGCCAHVMTIVWYLGGARHQQNILAPAEFLDEIIIRELYEL